MKKNVFRVWKPIFKTVIVLSLTGQKFAMLEIKTVVSKILRNFTLHSLGPENDIIVAAEAVLSSRNGFNLKLTRREWWILKISAVILV